MNNKEILFSGIVSIVILFTLSYTLLPFYEFIDSKVGTNAQVSLNSILGIVIEFVCLFIYMVIIHALYTNLTSPGYADNKKPIADSYAYRAEKLAEEEGISQSQALKILLKRWIFHWIAIPFTFTFFMGINIYLFIGLLIYPSIWILNQIHLLLVDAINKLDASLKKIN